MTRGTDRGPVRSPRRQRPVLLEGLLGVVVLGVALQLVRGGSVVVDLAGGVLYALAWVLLVALVAPTARALTCASVAAAVGVLLELLQLSGVPARLSEQVPPLRLLLGSTFSGWDLLSCLLGPPWAGCC